MVLFRILGRLFFLAGLVTFGYDLWRWLVDGEAFRMIEIGYLWNMIDSTSQQISQAAVQRYVWPFLWDVVVTVLLWPAALTFAGFGLILMILFRRRRRTGRYG